MKNRGMILLCALLAAGCSKERATSDKETSEIEIHKEIQAQASAWNRGDISAFMSSYLAEDSLLFIGRRGLTYGYKKVLENYQRSYPTPAAMGKLKFDVHRLHILGDSAAFMVGSWQLRRSEDAPSGWFSLLWVKTKSGWKIAADHTS
ncbi:MAG: nuclear transport factor 2 family protein [Flavobacteriales bacterium]|nr:nuclear transport factor 2 family protein [Flavobacteriales bacterium]